MGFWNQVVRYTAERNCQRVEMRIGLRLPLGIDVPALQETVRG